MAILRSVGAVVAGVVFVVASSTATDLVLEHTILPTMKGPQVSPPLLGLALAYRTLYGVVAGWITAKLAPGRRMTHAMVLGAIGTAVAAAGVVATWSLGQHWYPIALAVLAAPQTWLGARLAGRGVQRAYS
jgi:uncharacterized membrane protein YeaQ/YmgE (transglycosylase-associated protein family)